MRCWVGKSKRLGHTRSLGKKMHSAIAAVPYYAITLLQRSTPVYLPENALVILVSGRAKNTSAATSQWTD